MTTVEPARTGSDLPIQETAGDNSHSRSARQLKRSVPSTTALIRQQKRSVTTADWAAGPFRLGAKGRASLSLRPLVLGPGNVPVITDAAEAARDLPLAVFSALTHGDAPEAPDVLDAVASALGRADAGSVDYYSQLLEIGLGNTPARDIWRRLMTIYFPGRGTLAEEKFLEGKAEGRAEGKVEGLEKGLALGRAETTRKLLLRQLDEREIRLLPRSLERIRTSTDPDELERWLDHAFTATTAEEVLGSDDT